MSEIQKIQELFEKEKFEEIISMISNDSPNMWKPDGVLHGCPVQYHDLSTVDLEGGVETQIHSYVDGFEAQFEDWSDVWTFDQPKDLERIEDKHAETLSKLATFFERNWNEPARPDLDVRVIFQGVFDHMVEQSKKTEEADFINSLRSACSDCERSGVKVDTTAGEIMFPGGVLVAPGGETLLMAGDDQYGGSEDLFCDDCWQKRSA